MNFEELFPMYKDPRIFEQAQLWFEVIKQTKEEKDLLLAATVAIWLSDKWYNDFPEGASKLASIAGVTKRQLINFEKSILFEKPRMFERGLGCYSLVTFKDEAS